MNWAPFSYHCPNEDEGMRMLLLYCDETNLQDRAGDFLIYGGLIVSGERAGELSRAIDQLRSAHRVPSNYHIKFNPGPEGFNHQQFVVFKSELIKLAAEFGARLIVYVILHDVASDPDTARRNGINTICYHFDCILEREEGRGLVLIDRFTDAGNLIDAHLREKFTVGIRGLPFSPVMKLKNILGFHYSAIGQSHFPSLIDVVLGSLRFAINAHTRRQEQNYATAKALLELLAPLFWRGGLPGAGIPELGFAYSPKTIRVVRYREQYKSLKEFLSQGGVATIQQVDAPAE